MSEICRAITFINYHIPYREHDDSHYQYTTLGFFDGMDTKALNVNYARDDLRELWKYILERTVKSNGLYSYQNVFCFSNDEWNNCNDAEFWNVKTDIQYPLTFVSFLQLEDYAADKEKIQERCIKYSDGISKMLESEGKTYIYSTIDKNDFVICIKCTNYKRAVAIIQEMHRTQKTVYSYTVFSVLNNVLEKLSKEKKEGIYQQILPSICLKGVSNSYDPLKQTTLDKRYHDFCMRLVSQIYALPQKALSEMQGKKIKDPDIKGGSSNKEFQVDYKLYDILGEDDFRLIVRNVNLGRLIEQLSDSGILSYRNRNFRFYLYSSNLILNTETKEYSTTIGEQYRSNILERMEIELKPSKCELLEQDIDKIKEVIFQREGYDSEKMITCCHGIWQLIQSMKALEAAPIKKYDFLSLYYPLKSFVQILNKKLSEGEPKQLRLLAENEEIFEFIHKISLTIYGTLRTDIQFFQIRDFNVIAHYAPAKLRAFYTLWTLKIKDYYNMFTEEETNEYSFIFSPGMFSGTSVQQLFKKYDESHRLMLITVPERHLYVPKGLMIVLAHETSHFVGWKIRNRKAREKMWLNCCKRVFLLEMRKYVFESCPPQYQNHISDYLKTNKRFEEVFSENLAETYNELIKKEPLWPHQFHSENSFKTINKAFLELIDNDHCYFDKACVEECERISNFLKDRLKLKQKDYMESVKMTKEIRNYTEGLRQNITNFYNLYRGYCLVDLLNWFRYISSEVYADINAILTLSMSPKDYLASFFSCELDRGYLETYNQDLDMLLPFRIALSQKTISNVLKMKKEWEKEEEVFCKAWSPKKLEELPQEFPFDSKESNLAIKCYNIFGAFVDYNKEIQNYKSVYQVRDVVFSLKESNLFTDQKIWDSLLFYLQECTKDYILSLMKDINLREKKKELANTYLEISGKSPNQMMQEMENFLWKECQESVP